jgi:hypothetical protein
LRRDYPSALMHIGVCIEAAMKNEGMTARGHTMWETKLVGRSFPAQIVLPAISTHFDNAKPPAVFAAASRREAVIDDDGPDGL